MKIKVNENFGNLKPNYLFSETAQKARKYRAEHPDQKVISLGIGDVTQPLAPVVIEAMQKAVLEMGVKETFRGYAPEYGYDFIREAIAGYYVNKLNIAVKANEVFVGDGAKSDLGNIVDILGDNRILIPDPVYPVYMDSNIMSGRSVTLLPATAENNFLPTPPDDDIPSVVYLCSPNNPTGAVYDYDKLKKWVDYAKKTGSLIIFDSAYESYIREDLPHSIFAIEGARDCAIEINSLSKMAGFTGTRMGYTVIPETLTSGEFNLNKMWARRQATKFNGVPYVVQRAGEAVFTERGLKECKDLVDYYLENAKLIAELLEKKGVWFTGGVNSPYIWLKCPDGFDSWSFFDYLLEKAQIIGTPGVGFGANGEGYFRLTSFGSRENTLEAVARLDKLL
ncbi:MAG: LL-diaminopimelate aminotransferase [Clostridia bacterium]|nr:LL-diaminopimelate aminotransferase [Clostridia bacterium]